MDLIMTGISASERTRRENLVAATRNLVMERLQLGGPSTRIIELKVSNMQLLEELRKQSSIEVHLNDVNANSYYFVILAVAQCACYSHERESCQSSWRLCQEDMMNLLQREPPIVSTDLIRNPVAYLKLEMLLLPFLAKKKLGASTGL
ncbi:hypothetical protein BHM03_00009721 [Ensete ventricosum]|nr:hypothetical protein BHM03_00009721 [Ensete ventricosum]